MCFASGLLFSAIPPRSPSGSPSQNTLFVYHRAGTNNHCASLICTCKPVERKRPVICHRSKHGINRATAEPCKAKHKSINSRDNHVTYKHVHSPPPRSPSIHHHHVVPVAPARQKVLVIAAPHKRL